MTCVVLPNVGKNWFANFLAKESSTYTWLIIWEESAREMEEESMATNILGTNQTWGIVY
jgi:hypothetical protein